MVLRQGTPAFLALSPSLALQLAPPAIREVTLENQQPVRSVTVTKTSKARKYLEDFEVWIGKKAGEKAVKCGGPFAWSKIKKGPVTTPCDFAKSKFSRRLLVAARPTHPTTSPLL